MKEVYSIDDLASRERLDEGADQPARLAVIGHPVQHSLSPQLHQPALDEAEAGMRYIRIDIEAGRLADALAAMKDLGFLGTNVTVPHKFEALAACDELDEGASVLGAVNTVLFEDGRALGFNTDGPGFGLAVREEFAVDLKDLRIMIVGAGGGAGRAVAAQCAREGCERLILVNRTLEKAEQLREELAHFFHSERLEGPGDRLVVAPLDSPLLPEEAGHADLIVNTTSLGLKRTDPSPLPGNCLQPHHLVYDTIYNPPQTRLLADAARAGARTANGLSLLLHQGALAFDLWFPGRRPVDTMRRALAAALK
ncbi:MAG: shikimate dehydrogenase [Akkermansiaceae bacterium]|nr:shikimate dehydrogenase [Akkermansiaceae bacterium]NNM28300.1 shikimate dehydrogenase [Akkermansiaceae bacterium]